MPPTTNGDDPHAGNGHDVEDPDVIAAAAGLVRLAVDEPGIRRLRRGRGFSFHAPDGALIEGDRRAEIEALAVPPAWTDVWIAADPDSHILATGIDGAGRKQYLYHSAWRRAADEAKFRRLATFGPSLVSLRRQVSDHLRGPLDDTSTQAALVVRLMDHCLLRVGSRVYADDNDTYGATTLLAGHVDVDRSTIRLCFTAKGGIEREVAAEDRLLARRLGEMIEQLDDDAPIFHDDDGRPIARDTVNRYIEQHAGGRFTAKDFRTWGASCTVTERLAVAPVVDDAEEHVRAAIEVAADVLGNTPAICRSSYVAPAVIAAYENDDLAAVWRRARSSRWMSRAERVCGRVLASQ